MANYPVKLLKDKDGTAFIPVVNSDSIITPEGDTLNDLLEEKQDLLTSGTNIKTINNESLLGSGNISIQGGSGASVWGSITGTLSNQTDLQTELSNKASKSFYSDTTINVGRKSNTTVGYNSTAEGIDTTASGGASHAEGWDTIASGQSSHAEGEQTEASGLWSHAEGEEATASGDMSHAEGSCTAASGEASHAEGELTVANSKAQHVFGRYNISDANDDTTDYGDYVEIVGNGSYNARSNARTLDWSGNETLAGDLTSSGTVKATKGLWSRPTGEVGTATSDSNSCLLIKRANNTEAPNNGVVLEFGNSADWRGQLYIGENATQGIYYNGWSDGVRGTWRKLGDAPVTLYNNSSGASGNVTLNDNVANYSYLEIIYQRGEGQQNSTKMISAVGNKATLISTLYSGNTMYIDQKGITLTTNGITDSFHSVMYSSGGSVTVGTNNNIKIVRVLGYK